ncbi:MAG TPA: F0F1 ATP synthase subunit A [Acidimicrobiia bacterium]|nr:F0F1 ATP synthase subunit A [Acidimicrobiia bacterium]
MILATECDVVNEVICAPAKVTDLFEFDTWFTVGGLEFTRTTFLMLFAALVTIAVLYFGLRNRRLVPSKFDAAVEGLVGFVRDDIGRDIIGPDSRKYLPYLLSIFLFILVGNLFEVTPLINFPITSRMAIPLFLALVTYVIFMFQGFKKNKLRYLIDTAWPKHVPLGLRWLVGLIELVSIFFLRPITLAIRLFANLVAGHLLLTLLLGSAVIFIASVGEIGAKSLIAVPWLALGLFMFVLELLVSALQAYIFTLLTAVYIESSIHFEH